MSLPREEKNDWVSLQVGEKTKKPLKLPFLAKFRQFSEAFSGGAGRVRTDDPQTASLMLSQLSYSPTIPIFSY